ELGVLRYRSCRARSLQSGGGATSCNASDPSLGAIPAQDSFREPPDTGLCPPDDKGRPEDESGHGGGGTSGVELDCGATSLGTERGYADAREIPCWTARQACGRRDRVEGRIYLQIELDAWRQRSRFRLESSGRISTPRRGERENEGRPEPKQS